MLKDGKVRVPFQYFGNGGGGGGGTLNCEN